MADDLLLVYSAPGAVDLAAFNDWYDNEHVPARLATPGFGTVARYRATDGLKPDWLATYLIKPGTLDTPAYKALWENASEREKRIMSSLSTLDRRVYSLMYDSWVDDADGTDGIDRVDAGPAPVIMAVSMSVPPAVVPELEAHYRDEHLPLLLSVPGWRRARRYLLTSGTGPKYLSLHELDSQAVFDEPGYKAAVSTPQHKRIVASAIGRERRVFKLHKAFG